MLLVTSNTAVYQINIPFDYNMSANTSKLDSDQVAVKCIYNNIPDSDVSKRI